MKHGLAGGRDRQDLLLEQALAREAIRLAFAHHLTVALGVGGDAGPNRIGLGRPGAAGPRRRAERPAGNATAQGEALIRPDRLGLIIGSGGVLSHAPRRAQAALMLLDAIAPAGFCRLAVDSVFMMPHLGALTTLDPEAAQQVFWRDCLIPLATVAAPVRVSGAEGPAGLRGRIDAPDGARRVAVPPGELAVVPVPSGRRVRVELQPDRGTDLGAGPGRVVRREVEGGVVGLILDGRGRPLRLPPSAAAARATVARWLRAAGALPMAGAPPDRGL